MNKRKCDFDVGKFTCQNKNCQKYHEPNTGHVIFAYMNVKSRSTAYLRCTICGKYFSENKGTFFYRRKKSKETIVQALQNTVEGCGIRATARVFNLSKDTVLAWVKHAGEYSRELEKKLLKTYA